MRTLVSIAAVVLMLAFTAGSTDAADIQGGISIEDGKIRDFHISVSKEYGADEKELVVLHKQHRIPADELPVIYYIARKAGKNPKEVIELRLEGKSYWEIAIRLELKPEHFYVPVKQHVTEPPYGRALGHFKKEKKRWVRIALTDTDMVNLVNLRLMHDRFDVSYEQIIAWRTEGASFVDINERAYYHKHGKPSPHSAAARSDDDQPKGAGKDKGKGKNK